MLYEVITVTPAMCAWLLPALADREPRLSRLAVWALERYRVALRAIVNRPWLVFSAVATLAIAATRNNFV